MKDHIDGIYNVVVYNDFTGDVIDSGAYKICEGCNVNTDCIEDYISDFDGQRIFLKQTFNGTTCYLIKVQ